MQVVRLLEHFAEPSGTQKLVTGTPAFHGVGQQRVTEPKCGGAEGGRHGYVRIRIVAIAEPLCRQLKTVLFHRELSQKLRQELVVSNVLDHRADDSPRFLLGHETNVNILAETV